MKHYAVVGRIIGRDEDTIVFFRADHYLPSEAQEAAKVVLWDAEDQRTGTRTTAAQRLALDEDGNGCVINTVLVSDTPIMAT